VLSWRISNSMDAGFCKVDPCVKTEMIAI
jgi:hypothetical protein